MDRRQRTYFALRGLAALGVVGSAALLPRGLPAALLMVAFGVLAVLTCFGVNAGGPGERAGARARERGYAQVRAPQGQWPPYEAAPYDRTADDGRVVEGELQD